MMRILTGLLQATYGTIEVDDVNVRNRARYMNLVGYVPDEPFFYEDLTGAEFLRFTNDLHQHEDLTVAMERLDPLLTRLGIKDVLHRRIHTYSLGTKRKLAIILAVIRLPKYLLLDEPFNGLDPISTYHIKEFLTNFCHQGGGILISTHQLDLVETIATHVTVINEGKVIVSESLQSFIKSTGSSLERNLIVTIQAAGSDAREDC